MGMFSILPQDKIDIYDEIAYELRSAIESEEMRRVICERADEFLPQHEAELMYALFTRFEDQVCTERNILGRKFPDIEMDIIHPGYQCKPKESYELDRKNALADILSERDSITAVKKFYEAAEPLREAARGIAYNMLVSFQSVLVNYIEVCSRLLRNGKLSLTEIVSCLPGLKMYDLYGLAQKLDIPVQVTDEEMERIHKEAEQARKPKITNMKDVMDYMKQDERK